MTRTEAIEQINHAAARLDDERVQLLLSLARKLASEVSPSQRTRALSARELRGLEQSKTDFADGRTLDQQQYEALMADFMSELKAGAKSSS